MTLRKEDMTVEMGLSSTIDFPLLSALTIDLKASFNILLPMSYSTRKAQNLRPNQNFLNHGVLLHYRENSSARLVAKTTSKRKLIEILPAAALKSGEPAGKKPDDGGAMDG